MSSKFVRSVAAACVLAGLVLGCGSGSRAITTSGFPASAAFFSLPYLPTTAGEVGHLILANYAVEDAPVTVQAYGANAGAAALGEPLAAPSTIVVPANGTLRVPTGMFTGPGAVAGHIFVDTRDVGTLDPVTGEPTPIETTGFVVPSLERTFSGVLARGDALPGVVPHDACHVALMSETTSVQAINLSVMHMVGGSVPVPVTVTLREFDAEGTEFATFDVLLPPYGSLEFAPPTSLGHITLEVAVGGLPAGSEARFALATREEGAAVHVAPRFFDLPHIVAGVHDIGYFVDWGQDAFGNVYDFGLLISNPTDEAQTATIRGIFRDSPLPILLAPRTLSIAPRRTVFYGTTVLASDGLALGELHPFADLFGDALATTSYERAAIWVSVPGELEVSARAFDPAFDSFRLIERGGRRTTNAFASSQPVEALLGTGRLHEVLIANPLDRMLVIPVLAHTPGGTQYLLGSIDLGPYQRRSFTLDGSIFREDPNSLVDPPVERMKIKFSPLSGAMFSARSTTSAFDGRVLSIVPRIVDAAD